MKAWLTRLHTWVGVIVGVQLILWLASGLTMSLLDPEVVSGASTRAPEAEVVNSWPQDATRPSSLLAGAHGPAQVIERAWRMGRPFWRVQSASGTTLVDAHTGAEWAPSAAEVSAIAKADYSGDGAPAAPRRWTTSPLEARGHDGPVWQVDFSDEAGTTLYVSASDATVVERRNDAWRLFDIAWMLHIMDYTGREDFNHPLIVSFAVAGLWMVLSGLWLLGYAIKGGHLRPRWGAARVQMPLRGSDGAGRVITGCTGETVLAAFARSDEALPSRCGGGQTCGMCVVRVGADAPISEGDRRLIAPDELAAGHRLACSLPVRAGLQLEHVESGGHSRWQEAVVEQVVGISASLREILLRPLAPTGAIPAGSYMLVEIPAYSLPRDAWLDPVMPAPQHLLEHGRDGVTNTEVLQRAYSPSLTPELASGRLPLLVRLDVDPRRPEPVGRGSAWLFARRPGDRVRLMGPFGDFRLKPGPREKIFIGGGAGMAPLRAMVREALATESSGRMHFWYGARKVGDVPYAAELRELATWHAHFDFHVVYSEDANEEFGPRWVHEAVHDSLLATHHSLTECDFYLCGPPAMLEATRRLLAEFGVPEERVAFDDFDA